MKLKLNEFEALVRLDGAEKHIKSINARIKQRNNRIRELSYEIRVLKQLKELSRNERSVSHDKAV